jgi:NADPH-dependent 2,4-dienoyl-CoA reductase/sulfur reductase-like enzyme/nitrite reductase/ring-hydroxylating ferredoxin subunit
MAATEDETVATETTLTGPDLTQGVDADQLAPGATLLGHAYGDAVLLARVAEEYFAIGATCTHYSGPLAEGLLDGDTVRCPWHHACFNLRTGDALRAPALSPTPCYSVERHNGRIVVGEKIERDPLAPSSGFSVDRGEWPRDVVIVGAGAAGAAAMEMLRRCGYDARITVVDEDGDAPYDRPNLSKDYLAGNAPEEWIPIRPADFYGAHGIEIVRASATRLDVGAKRLEVDGHAPISFDKLLLATGAGPIRLPLPGADAPHVHYLRSLSDSRAIIARAKLSKRAVVIGSSFIGLETAASLRARDVDVHVVAPEQLPLERVLGPQLGTFIRSLHEEKGVVFHLGHTAQRIEADAVVLDDGSRLPADMVVVGIGVRPRLDLAERAGLAIERGISVSAQLETSVPGIFAAGDIVRWPDPRTGERIRVEHWVVAQRQGQTAARNILGANEAFDFVPFFWSAHYDVSINYVGHAERWDRIDVDGDANSRDFSARFMSGDKLLALATIYRDRESLETELAMERALAS